MKKDWSKLKENICPLCGQKILHSGQSDYDCLHCGFYCRYSVAQGIIAEVELKEYDAKVDRWIEQHS